MQISPTDRSLRLDEFLRQVLEKADEFVPSKEGMILLDDPTSKTVRVRGRNKLAAVACFGPRASRELGKHHRGESGIIGNVYVTGEPFVGMCSAQGLFGIEEGPSPKRTSRGKAHSVLCVPIAIRESIVGVLSLSEKRKGPRYAVKDLELLMIFADYISASIQNFLDAKRNADTARRDALTGLSNDRQLHAVLKTEALKAWRNRRELSLVFLDLDRFKAVNDEHGHLVGSQVLAEVGYLLKTHIERDWPRAEIARYGGDEYVIVLPGCDARKAVAVSESVRAMISQNVHITASLGVASLLEHVKAPDPSRLLKLADEAMYEAKRAGRNRVALVTSRAAPGPAAGAIPPAGNA